MQQKTNKKKQEGAKTFFTALYIISLSLSLSLSLSINIYKHIVIISECNNVQNKVSGLSQALVSAEWVSLQYCDNVSICQCL